MDVSTCVPVLIFLAKPKSHSLAQFLASKSIFCGFKSLSKSMFIFANPLQQANFTYAKPCVNVNNTKQTPNPKQ